MGAVTQRNSHHVACLAPGVVWQITTPRTNVFQSNHQSGFNFTVRYSPPVFSSSDDLLLFFPVQPSYPSGYFVTRVRITSTHLPRFLVFHRQHSMYETRLHFTVPKVPRIQGRAVQIPAPIDEVSDDGTLSPPASPLPGLLLLTGSREHFDHPGPLSDQRFQSA